MTLKGCMFTVFFLTETNFQNTLLRKFHNPDWWVHPCYRFCDSVTKPVKSRSRSQQYQGIILEQHLRDCLRIEIVGVSENITTEEESCPGFKTSESRIWLHITFLDYFSVSERMNSVSPLVSRGIFRKIQNRTAAFLLGPVFSGGSTVRCLWKNKVGFLPRTITAGLKVIVVGIYKDLVFKTVPQVIICSPRAAGCAALKKGPMLVIKQWLHVPVA